VAGPTLTRFFTVHFLLPFLIVGLVACHITVLHYAGSSTPVKRVYTDQLCGFIPYYYFKDVVASFVVLFVFVFISFQYPNLLGHVDNYTPANPLVTPPHIVPE
jgi:ubiquinol-cytochrome c reductase cytochrome b/c1 subunit